MKHVNHTAQAGFTLIEIAIVLAIIALIAGGVMSGASDFLNQAKDVKAGKETGKCLQYALTKRVLTNVDMDVSYVTSCGADSADTEGKTLAIVFSDQTSYDAGLKYLKSVTDKKAYSEPGNMTLTVKLPFKLESVAD